MPATPRDVSAFSKQLTIIIGLTVVGFMTFGLTLSFYRNILFEETLQELEERNRAIARDIETGYGELEYYRSEQFRDKFAKENLNRLNPGERAIVLQQEKRSALFAEPESLSDIERREAAYQELLRQMPVLEHWQLYLFHRERIDELKRSL